MATPHLGDNRKHNHFGTLATMFSTFLRIVQCFSCTTQPTTLIKWNKIMKENVFWANLMPNLPLVERKAISHVRRAAPSYITDISDEFALAFCLIIWMD